MTPHKCSKSPDPREVEANSVATTLMLALPNQTSSNSKALTPQDSSKVTIAIKLLISPKFCLEDLMA
ncbi:hypothetical protein BOTNAR_0002g00210 [Botryotinia narcissicola]|uniref:Uncharacterized protein n=1 Tax=Botryotinia narcissicola TaxID=278944 RepID=A0A4Z1JMU0_9HELO|nr:hypothetical protein BOTNAR_0002g00210 [Botryotinia narcissicola]